MRFKPVFMVGLFLSAVLVLGMSAAQASAGAEETGGGVLVDSFEKNTNALGGRAATYQKEPSRALGVRTAQNARIEGGKSLTLKFDKKGEGGPYGKGGWCGFYELLKVGDQYFDATSKTKITFWVKGDTGEENFKLGLADRQWDEVGDSVKSKPVTDYLESGKITMDWQKVEVPLAEFFIDMKELASIAFCFETDLFEGGAMKSTVYIDDLRIE
ncbi:MAG: hypothetical protein JW937_09105 [Candidatus Omnitrophica bacterium]|nr:hypothetical protein [Candidatus Omnitrophota bacterium]